MKAPFVIAVSVASSLLIGAHFLRAGNIVLAVLFPGSAALFFVKAPWAALIQQILHYIAAAIWIETLVRLTRYRILAGQAWGRMAIILGTVAAVSVLAGMLVNSSAVKKRNELSE